MARSRILCLRTIEKDSDDRVVVQVGRSGEATLDLNLVGSEGEHPYKASLKQAHLSKSRARNYKGDDNEWQSVLRWVLLREEPPPQLAEFVHAIELVSQVDTSRICLILRQSVPVEGGRPITQQLGSLYLERDDDLDANSFDWAATAARAAAEAEQQCMDLKAQLAASHRDLSRSNAQLESLVKAKREHENELLEKFRQLLNAKKLKIRDQQRLLAGAKVDSNKAAQVKEARSTTKGQPKSRSPRGAKRKARVEPQNPDRTEDDKKELSPRSPSKDEESEDDHPMRTPETSQAETSDEEGGLQTARPTEPSKQPGDPSKDRGELPKQNLDLSRDLPPRRELPIALRGTDKGTPPSKQADDEDEETDDEL